MLSSNGKHITLHEFVYMTFLIFNIKGFPNPYQQLTNKWVKCKPLVRGYASKFTILLLNIIGFVLNYIFHNIECNVNGFDNNI